MAGDYIITGGRPLNGTVRVPAAKNSVLPLLAASLLCSGPVRLCGVPELADVAESLALLRSAGCTAERQGADVRVDGVPGSGTLAAGPAGRMRASILFCAPLLARLGRAQTVLPGGCRIGARPIDLHLAGLVQMGACPQLEGERLLLTAPAGLHGADITLRFPSVGATETLLLAAALAQGETTLRGAAREPEIEDLAAFLNRCGGRARILVVQPQFLQWNTITGFFKLSVLYISAPQSTKIFSLGTAGKQETTCSPHSGHFASFTPGAYSRITE